MICERCGKNTTYPQLAYTGGKAMYYCPQCIVDMSKTKTYTEWNGTGGNYTEWNGTGERRER